MDQPEDLVGQHADLHLPYAEKLVEPLEAGLRRISEALRLRVAPLATHGRLRGLGDLDVGSRQGGVADDTDGAVDAFERLADDFEDGRREVARDAVVVRGALKACVQEAGVDLLPARRIPLKHGDEIRQALVESRRRRGGGRQACLVLVGDDDWSAPKVLGERRMLPDVRTGGPCRPGTC